MSPRVADSRVGKVTSREADVEQLRGSGLDEALNAEREAVLARWVEVVETGSRGRVSRAELTTELREILDALLECLKIRVGFVRTAMSTPRSGAFWPVFRKVGLVRVSRRARRPCRSSP